MNTNELARELLVSKATIRRKVKKYLPNKEVRQGKLIVLTEKELDIFIEKFTKDKRHYHYSTYADTFKKQFVDAYVEHNLSEPLITTMELAKALKVSRRCLLRMAHICFTRKIFQQGKQTYWNEREYWLLRNAFRKNKPQYDELFFFSVFPAYKGDRTRQWTTKEIADRLGIKPFSVTRIASKVLNKTFQKGKTTYYSRNELKEIFNSFTNNNPNQYTLSHTTRTLNWTQQYKATWRKDVKAK